MRVFKGLMAIAVALGAVLPTQSFAQDAAERYVPTIWVDPDGCEH